MNSHQDERGYMGLNPFADPDEVRAPRRRPDAPPKGGSPKKKQHQQKAQLQPRPSPPGGRRKASRLFPAVQVDSQHAHLTASPREQPRPRRTSTSSNSSEKKHQLNSSNGLRRTQSPRPQLNQGFSIQLSPIAPPRSSAMVGSYPNSSNHNSTHSRANSQMLSPRQYQPSVQELHGQSTSPRSQPHTHRPQQQQFKPSHSPSSPRIDTSEQKTMHEPNYSTYVPGTSPRSYPTPVFATKVQSPAQKHTAAQIQQSHEHKTLAAASSKVISPVFAVTGDVTITPNVPLVTQAELDECRAFLSAPFCPLLRSQSTNGPPKQSSLTAELVLPLLHSTTTSPFERLALLQSFARAGYSFWLHADSYGILPLETQLSNLTQSLDHSAAIRNQMLAFMLDKNKCQLFQYASLPLLMNMESIQQLMEQVILRLNSRRKVNPWKQEYTVNDENKIWLFVRVINENFQQYQFQHFLQLIEAVIQMMEKNDTSAPNAAAKTVAQLSPRNLHRQGPQQQQQQGFFNSTAIQQPQSQQRSQQQPLQQTKQQTTESTSPRGSNKPIWPPAASPRAAAAPVPAVVGYPHQHYDEQPVYVHTPSHHHHHQAPAPAVPPSPRETVISTIPNPHVSPTARSSQQRANNDQSPQRNATGTHSNLSSPHRARPIQTQNTLLPDAEDYASLSPNKREAEFDRLRQKRTAQLQRTGGQVEPSPQPQNHSASNLHSVTEYTNIHSKPSPTAAGSSKGRSRPRPTPVSTAPPRKISFAFGSSTPKSASATPRSASLNASSSTPNLASRESVLVDQILSQQLRIANLEQALRSRAEKRDELLEKKHHDILDLEARLMQMKDEVEKEKIRLELLKNQTPTQRQQGHSPRKMSTSASETQLMKQQQQPQQQALLSPSKQQQEAESSTTSTMLHSIPSSPPSRIPQMRKDSRSTSPVKAPVSNLQSVSHESANATVHPAALSPPESNSFNVAVAAAHASDRPVENDPGMSAFSPTSGEPLHRKLLRLHLSHSASLFYPAYVASGALDLPADRSRSVSEQELDQLVLLCGSVQDAMSTIDDLKKKKHIKFESVDALIQSLSQSKSTAF